MKGKLDEGVRKIDDYIIRKYNYQSVSENLSKYDIVILFRVRR